MVHLNKVALQSALSSPFAFSISPSLHFSFAPFFSFNSRYGLRPFREVLKMRRGQLRPPSHGCRYFEVTSLASTTVASVHYWYSKGTFEALSSFFLATLFPLSTDFTLWDKEIITFTPRQAVNHPANPRFNEAKFNFKSFIPCPCNSLGNSASQLQPQLTIHFVSHHLPFAIHQ